MDNKVELIDSINSVLMNTIAVADLLANSEVDKLDKVTIEIVIANMKSNLLELQSFISEVETLII